MEVFKEQRPRALGKPSLGLRATLTKPKSLGRLSFFPLLGGKWGAGGGAGIPGLPPKGQSRVDPIPSSILLGFFLVSDARDSYLQYIYIYIAERHPFWSRGGKIKTPSSQPLFAFFFSDPKMFPALIFLQVWFQTLAASGDLHWSYDEGPRGQAHWRDTYPDCGFQFQSPINIQTDSVQYDPNLVPIEPEGYRAPGNLFTVLNNAHTVRISLPETMSFRGLPHVYSGVQMHLHWGSKGRAGGSEHQVDGHAFAAELHVVHYNSEKYPNVSVAKHQPDGLAVLGVFLEAGKVANKAYDHILNHLNDIKYAEQEIQIQPFDVRDLLPVHLGHYFLYNGSLTTPPCYQSVLWVIFHQPVHISVDQLEKLQKSLYFTSEGTMPEVPLVDNFRALQNLNRRVIYSSFDLAYSGYSAGEIVAIIFGVLLGCAALFLAGWIVAKRIR